ncbi:isocitrate lyase/phosphoenolpyruvate mutase family protein [Pseudomonas syringae]|uniref:isocitrate lyase/PEP mutase family protein n=1 Tax=Pseudomonas syringae TaxID=317 RepID=UPI001916E1E7|nr:isocitrate lyase/phosphoenolpyruvate mutase family protein [Pseudomonas syringae]QQQ50576.1 isocitrate lyase/phosphoenolpyruvate mutase family protein [Pseudomonas syringae]
MKSLDNIFHELHNHGLLILANVSDAGGAKVVESLGATAIATSSAGMAWAHGYADGNQLPLTRLAASVESMTRILRVPLTVDIEAGYSDDLQHVASVVEAVVAAGAVGINIEDGTAPPEVLVRKIEVAREVADKHGINLFINARSDVYLKSLVPPVQRLDEIIRRAALYAQAGANGLFAAGMVTPAEISTLCNNCTLPVNLLARDGLSAPDDLQSLGVRRLSAGSSIAEFLYGAMEGLARSFIERGQLDTQALTGFTYAKLNGLIGSVDKATGP